MKLQSSTKHLLGTASMLAMLASSAATPANAAASNAIYFGGSTLASEAFRQIFNCYTGALVGTGAWTDGFQFSSSFNSATPTPGLLPTTCTVTSTVQGMYAGVGSGNGVRGYIANDPKQWYGGSINPPATFTLSTTTSTTIQPPFPAVQPPFADTLNTTFGSYPYPRVDAGLSDSPLPATFAAMTTTSITITTTTANTAGNNWNAFPVTVTASGSSVVSYTTTVTYGQPIQVPAFAVNVAIPVNVSTFTPVSQIKDGSGNIVNGGAIQLSEAQLCAIFSGKVTNWNSTATIPYLDQNGTKQTAPFYYTNVKFGVTAGQYTTANLPIQVVYRLDGSGTSFILTNYLKAVCPQIDASYNTIFNTANLPNNNFSALISNINDASITGSWVGVNGSGGVQGAVGITSTQSGRIGYVSADFVKPYAINTQAPYSASLQNEQQRAAGVNTPITTTTTTSPTFIAPTPDSALLAWQDPGLQTPSTTWTWNDYNIYNNVFAAGTPNQGGVNVVGKSVLPLTGVIGAYPLSGTTFLDLYSCYSVGGDSGRVDNLKNFLSWYFTNASGNALATAVIKNNGFAPLPDTYKSVIRSKYLGTINATRIAAAPPSGAGGTGSGGCTGVTGGAL